MWLERTHLEGKQRHERQTWRKWYDVSDDMFFACAFLGGIHSFFENPQLNEYPVGFGPVLL